MKTGFLDFEWFHDKKMVGSSRIRSTWLIKYWPGAEKFQDGKKYDVEIYQKVYWEGHLKASPAIKIIDICDPDWARRADKQFLNKIISKADAYVFPTEAYKRYFDTFFPDKPNMVIPDRIDLSLIKQTAKHEGTAKSIVWFGYSHNSGVLKQAIPTIKQLGLKLTIISDDLRIFLGDLAERNLFNFVKYNENTIYEELAKHDICLLPPHSMGDGRIPYAAKFKSNNKMTTAWACGLPVATNAEQLEFFMDEKHRQSEAQEKLELIKQEYDVKLSVLDYMSLIEKVA